VTRVPRPTAFSLEEALETLKARFASPPELLVVLGSGLGDLTKGVSDVVSVPFQEIPGFPDPGVTGHPGRLVFGELEGRRVLLQAGRFPGYEGHSGDLVAAPVRLAARMGARIVILTNAAGGIAPRLVPGSIMLISDHLNLMGRSPLAGELHGKEAVLGKKAMHGGEARSHDLAAPYDSIFQTRALELAEELGIPLSRGVYAGVLGPSYETPAEIRFLAQAGAHAVGMSTVPEAVVAAALGLRVLGFSLITNRAAGLGGEALSHSEVLEVGRTSGGALGRLLRAFIRDLAG
jgi:purine-nucleoside phosphorylase